MSLNFSTEQQIRFCDIFDGRLTKFGVHEDRGRSVSDGVGCLTDGRNYVWAYSDDNGFLSVLTVYAGNASAGILVALSEAFGTKIYSENEPQYWGFDTQEEWDAALDAAKRPMTPSISKS